MVNKAKNFDLKIGGFLCVFWGFCPARTSQHCSSREVKGGESSRSQYFCGSIVTTDLYRSVIVTRRGPDRDSDLRRKKMAMASSSSTTAPATGQNDAAFSNFMTEVKEIEKRDSVLTPKQQIDRLVRPGSTYFNLNPYEVLQVNPSMEVPDIKKIYRRMSILVHPDKNMDDRDRAQKAFDALSNAMKMLEDETSRKSVLDTIEEAKQKTEFLLGEKRKQLKRDGKPTAIEEDDPVKYQETLHKTTVKLFADYAIRRKEIEEKEARIKKREREEEIKEEDKTKKQKEWQKDWEDGRDKRVNNWRDFTDQNAAKKKKKNRMTFKPPKPKLEQR